MSYILDALRRAESERERGAVPGLHVQQEPVADFSEAPAPRRHGWMPAAIGLLSVLLLGVVGWVWLRGDPPPANVVVQAPVPAPLPPMPVTPAPVAVAEAPAPAPKPAPRRMEPAPPAAATDAPAPRRRAEPADDAPVRTARGPEPTAPPAVQEPRIFTLDELPPNIRRELPPLSIGGASYSENPASRMLIINGQVFHERDKLAPNLTLEQIRLKSAVLDYRGYRYRVAY